MNFTLVKNINSVVGINDRLFILGDFTLSRNKNIVKKYRQQIACNNIYYVLGNHDDVIEENAYYFKDDFLHINHCIYKTFSVQNKKVKIWMAHYAHKTWRSSHYGSYHLYGHSHGSLQDDPNSLSFDVGVDTNNFRPYSLQDVERIMAGKTFKPIDHHAKRIRE
jgi:calcineurin-like phosphoesterase family protein